MNNTRCIGSVIFFSARARLLVMFKNNLIVNYFRF